MSRPPDSRLRERRGADEKPSKVGYCHSFRLRNAGALLRRQNFQTCSAAVPAATTPEELRRRRPGWGGGGGPLRGAGWAGPGRRTPTWRPSGRGREAGAGREEGRRAEWTGRPHQRRPRPSAIPCLFAAVEELLVTMRPGSLVLDAVLLGQSPHGGGGGGRAVGPRDPRFPWAPLPAAFWRLREESLMPHSCIDFPV